MEKSRISKGKKMIVSCVLTAALIAVTVSGVGITPEKELKADAASANATTPIKVNAAITGELTGKRTKFVKQFAMSDGSYTAAIYSMPVHYKKNGKWKEINTTHGVSAKAKQR